MEAGWKRGTSRRSQTGPHRRPRGAGILKAQPDEMMFLPAVRAVARDEGAANGHGAGLEGV